MKDGSGAGVITARQIILAALKPQKRRPLREHPQCRLQKPRVKAMLAGKLFGAGGRLQGREHAGGVQGKQDLR